MSDVINSQGMVIIFFLAVILIPQFLYFEISFLVRGRNDTPKITESLIVGLVVAVGVVAFWLNHGEGVKAGSRSWPCVPYLSSSLPLSVCPVV